MRRPPAVRCGRNKAGYDQVVPELSAGDEEQLVDIKSTISHIKADKARRRQEMSTLPRCCGSAFPTQHLRRENVSFVKAAGAARYGASYPENGDSGYDGAVMLAELSRKQKSRRKSIAPMCGRCRTPPVPEKRTGNGGGAHRRVLISKSRLPENFSARMPGQYRKNRRPPDGTGRRKRTTITRKSSRPAAFVPFASVCAATPSGKMRTSASRMIWAW